MAQRFSQIEFVVDTLPCVHCGGELEVVVEGHVSEDGFSIHTVTNKFTGKELPLSPEQEKYIRQYERKHYDDIVREQIRTAA